MRFSALSLVLLALMLILVSSAQAQSTSAVTSCFVRPALPVGLRNLGDPVAVSGLVPQVRMPYEGALQLALARDRDNGSQAWSPTGDFTSTVGPYDPVSRRLYVWGYFTVGWIEMFPHSGTWLFGERGKIHPRLFDPGDDGKGDSVRFVQRSDILGLQFYEGWTPVHWLTGRQTYRFFQIAGTQMRRVPELEHRNLRYLGDDLVAGMAVFLPSDVSWPDRRGKLVWCDGTSVIEPEPDDAIPDTPCE